VSHCKPDCVHSNAQDAARLRIPCFGNAGHARKGAGEGVLSIALTHTAECAPEPGVAQGVPHSGGRAILQSEPAEKGANPFEQFTVAARTSSESAGGHPSTQLVHAPSQ